MQEEFNFDLPPEDPGLPPEGDPGLPVAGPLEPWEIDLDTMTQEEIDALFGEYAPGELPPGLYFDPVTGELLIDPLFGDAFYDFGGDETFAGTAENDYFFCGLGDDVMTGGEGFDELDYSEADFALVIDLLAGLITGMGQDQVSGIEYIIGSLFGDDFSGDLGDNWFDGGAGNDDASGGDGDDVLDGGTGDDDLDGGLGDDDITGGAGIDDLIGGSGNDELDGQGGKDKLVAGAGNDILDGGLGTDRMTGGAGKDVFDFDFSKESTRGSGRDVITDFRHLTDDINLRGIDANSRLGGNQNFKFIGFQDFHGRAGELHLTKVANGVILSGDINGDSKADFEIMIVRGTISSADLIL